MKSRIIRTLSLLIAMVAIVSLYLIQVASAASSTVEKQAMPVLMKMYEKNIALLQRGSVEGKSSPPMTKQQLVDTTRWLKSLKFGQFPSPIKQDFESYRQQLLATCSMLLTPSKAYSPPGYRMGTAYGQLCRKFLPLMIDFDIDEAKVKKYGYSRFAQEVDRDAILAHVMIIVEAKLDQDSFDKTDPTTQVFIDLFTMFNFLAGSEGRNIMLQGSIYCVHPEKVKDAAQRKALVDAKAKVLGLSHHISDKEDQKLLYIVLAIDSLCDAHKVCRIADSDLKKVGGTALVNQVHGMIKLRNGK